MKHLERVTSDQSLSIEERYVYSVLTALYLKNYKRAFFADGRDVTKKSLANGLGFSEERFMNILRDLDNAGLITLAGDDYDSETAFFWTDQMKGPPSPFEPDGWVYVAYSTTGHYKVGRSVDPSSRVDHFDTQMPVEVEILYQIPCDDYKSAERRLHELLSDCRVKGEWFDLPIATIKVLGDIIRYVDGEFRVCDEYTRESVPAELPQQDILELDAAGPGNDGLDIEARITDSLDSDE